MGMVVSAAAVTSIPLIEQQDVLLRSSVVAIEAPPPSDYTPPFTEEKAGRSTAAIIKATIEEPPVRAKQVRTAAKPLKSIIKKGGGRKK